MELPLPKHLQPEGYMDEKERPFKVFTYHNKKRDTEEAFKQSQQSQQTELSRAIRFNRERLGFSQRKLMKEIGVNCTAIAHWEAGRAIPKESNLKKLENVFGVPLAHLDIGQKPIRVCRSCEKDITYRSRNAIYCTSRCKDKMNYKSNKRVKIGDLNAKEKNRQVTP